MTTAKKTSQEAPSAEKLEEGTAGKGALDSQQKDPPLQDVAKTGDAPSAALSLEEQKELGKAAYLAYTQQVGNVDENGGSLASWEEIGETRQKAFVAAALAGYNAP